MEAQSGVYQVVEHFNRWEVECTEIKILFLLSLDGTLYSPFFLLSLKINFNYSTFSLLL